MKKSAIQNFTFFAELANVVSVYTTWLCNLIIIYI